ncbi:MAG: CDGSH iron-sulfur domain-containing protein [candidate division KSB1 bacterium]|nr:CDGSH iron-sulfur domain-containing protein [candidate division KSB1 bacterium]MDZ7371332.1 CDGSH iron-sulfur domain-containing protein [candidate division KSB1 bacterium]
MCEPIRITVKKNGPYIVEGDLDLRDGEGNPIKTEGTVYLCRCGGSNNKPFCDGTHRKNNFEG